MFWHFCPQHFFIVGVFLLHIQAVTTVRCYSFVCSIRFVNLKKVTSNWIMFFFLCSIFFLIWGHQLSGVLKCFLLFFSIDCSYLTWTALPCLICCHGYSSLLIKMCITNRSGKVHNKMLIISLCLFTALSALLTGFSRWRQHGRGSARRGDSCHSPWQLCGCFIFKRSAQLYYR